MPPYDDGLGQFARLCDDRTEWLMQRVLDYAHRTGYVRYTSTLAEAWRISIVGFNEAITDTSRRTETVRELSPEEDAAANPGTAFGVLEARRHRERGISLEMFLGLTKYYREAYRDLVVESGPKVRQATWLRFVDRFFDRFEIGFCSDWAGEYDGAVNTALLQRANRHMTNEKNKYLTIFESLHSPVVVFDAHGRVTAANRAARSLDPAFRDDGAAFYGDAKHLPAFAWLAETVAQFAASDRAELYREVQDTDRQCPVQIHLRRMLDVSGKFEGTVVALEVPVSAADPALSSR